MEEIWKPAKGFEGYYEVSNLGRVRSVDRVVAAKGNSEKLIKGKLLTLHTNKDGYKRTTLCKENKLFTKFVHRLIAEVFIPNPDNLPQVNHKDEVKSNNCVDNLEWCTAKYNINYGTAKQRTINTKIEKGSIYPEEIRSEKKKNYNKKYYLKNKEIILKNNREYYKEYYLKNKEKVKERYRIWYLNNSDCRKNPT